MKKPRLQRARSAQNTRPDIDREEDKDRDEDVEGEQQPAADNDPPLNPDKIIEGQRPKFRILPELFEPASAEVMETISDRTQKQWLKTYKDPAWIRHFVAEAILFYTARGDDISKGWGILLHKALQRAKHGGFTTKSGHSATESVLDDPDFLKSLEGGVG